MILCEFCKRRFEPVWKLDYYDGMYIDYTCKCPICGEEYIAEKIDYSSGEWDC